VQALQEYRGAQAEERLKLGLGRDLERARPGLPT
jgi:hypothetical protein